MSYIPNLDGCPIYVRESGYFSRGRVSSRTLRNIITCQLIPFFENLSEVECDLYWMLSFNLQVIVNHLIRKDSDGIFSKSIYLRQSYSIFINSFKKYTLNLRDDKDLDMILAQLDKEEKKVLSILDPICDKYDDELCRIENNLSTYGKSSNFDTSLFIYGHTKTYVIERLRVLLALIMEFDAELSSYDKKVKKILRTT